jgi:hypothetical protein
VRTGETRRVEQLLAAMDKPERERAETRIAEASLRIAQDDPAAATAVLAPVIQGSAPLPNAHLWDVQAFLLQAIACDALGDPGDARRALELALDHAAPEQLLFPFLYDKLGAHRRHEAVERARALGLLAPGQLVLNNWLADLTETTAENLSFARRLDLDPAEIVDLLQLTPLGAPYAVQKARSMLAGDFSPAFALKHALKDAELAAQAAQASGATLTLTSALLPRWRDAAASGHADDDLSAVYLFS